MTILRSIILPWLASLILIGSALLCADPGRHQIADGINMSISCLLALVTYKVYRQEADRNTGLVALNLALCFSINTIPNIAYFYLERDLLKWDPLAAVYYFQYHTALYFLLLPLSVVYAALSGAFQETQVAKRYVVAVAVIVGFWLYLFYPYFENPRYLYSREDILHYKAIDSALITLAQQGIHTPNVEEVSDHVDLFVAQDDGRKTRLEGRERVQRVEELLPYLEASNYIPLVYKSLNRAALYMSLLCICAIVIFLVMHFLHDPPMPAYHEKVIYSMLLYCSFEALHYQFFSTTHSNEVLIAAEALGLYISVSVMLLLIALFSMRLSFILSIEGRYYETRIISDSGRVSRWRDALDNWVLRQFTRGNTLTGRFLVRDASEGDKSPEISQIPEGKSSK